MVLLLALMILNHLCVKGIAGSGGHATEGLVRPVLLYMCIEEVFNERKTFLSARP